MNLTGHNRCMPQVNIAQVVSTLKKKNRRQIKTCWFVCKCLPNYTARWSGDPCRQTMSYPKYYLGIWTLYCLISKSLILKIKIFFMDLGSVGRTKYKFYPCATSMGTKKVMFKTTVHNFAADTCWSIILVVCTTDLCINWTECSTHTGILRTATKTQIKWCDAMRRDAVRQGAGLCGQTRNTCTVHLHVLKCVFLIFGIGLVKLFPA